VPVIDARSVTDVEVEHVETELRPLRQGADRVSAPTRLVVRRKAGRGLPRRTRGDGVRHDQLNCRSMSLLPGLKEVLKESL